jgi:hypothetical protein
VDVATREELHQLVDALDPEEVDRVVSMLRPRAQHRFEREAPWPRTLGALSGAPSDLSARLDDYLAEGFAG